jgi:hypothetical protein
MSRRVRKGDYVPGWDDYCFFYIDRTTVGEHMKRPADQRNGFWMKDHNDNGLYVSCPVCGHLMSMRGFCVERDGTVDTEDCIRCPGPTCGVHFFAILEEWTHRKAAAP